MSAERREASQEALATAVVHVLRQYGRHSAHPGDQTALRQAAAQIARALQAEFVVVARQSPGAELTGGHRLSGQPHD